MGKRAQRIPSWPGVIHSNKGRIHLRRPTCDILKFRLRRSGGPYIPDGNPEVTLKWVWEFSNSAKSGYNKGTIRSDIRYLVVSKDVRRHRLISINYITMLPCHGRGRGFESRRPRHSK